MDAKLSGGAGDALHSLITSWSAPSSSRNDFAPVNLGQLKNIAKPFYDRLIAAGLAQAYPWASATNPQDDFAAANVGQVKNLFSFELAAADPLYDSDGNGLPDAWELQYFGRVGVDPAADADFDGQTNLQEYQKGTNPVDYYNGNPPGVSIISGDAQESLPSRFLPAPFVVPVYDHSGHPAANARVTFALVDGDGGLTRDRFTQPVASHVAVVSNSEGLAWVFFQQGSSADATSKVLVTTDANSRQATFTTRATGHAPQARQMIAAGEDHTLALLC